MKKSVISFPIVFFQQSEIKTATTDLFPELLIYVAR